MRQRRSLITVIVLLVVLGGVFYYFYGYRNREFTLDLGAVKAGTADAATTAAAKTALALSNRVSSFNIGVETTNGTVTLTGQVRTDEDKRLAEDIVRGTKGVGGVVNNIQVDPKVQAENAEKQRVTDLEIKVSVLQTLLNNPDLKTQQINAEVSNGNVRLIGKVQTPEMKAAAEGIARGVTNVQNVDSSGVVVTNTPSPAQAANPATTQPEPATSNDVLASHVELAILRDGSIAHPQDIKVRANSGLIYLTGTVGSRAEKALAGHIAKETEGARDVTNNLVVISK